MCISLYVWGCMCAQVCIYKHVYVCACLCEFVSCLCVRHVHTWLCMCVGTVDSKTLNCIVGFLILSSLAYSGRARSGKSKGQTAKALPCVSTTTELNRLISVIKTRPEAVRYWNINVCLRCLPQRTQGNTTVPSHLWPRSQDLCSSPEPCPPTPDRPINWKVYVWSCFANKFLQSHFCYCQRQSV